MEGVMKLYRFAKTQIGIFDSDLWEYEGDHEREEVGEVKGDIRVISDPMTPGIHEHAIHMEGVYITATGLIQLLDNGGLLSEVG